MSDTPKTDKKVYDPAGSFVEQYVVDADFARQFERELTTAKKDSERLDWLDAMRQDSPWEWSISLHDPKCVVMGKNTSSGFQTAREAIDTAMEKNNEKL